MTELKLARVEYKLIVDGKWITYPLNPNKVDNGVGGENSCFTMPDYEPTVWDKDFRQNVLTVAGIRIIEIESSKFGKRTVKIFIPSIYYKRSDKTARSLFAGRKRVHHAGESDKRSGKFDYGKQGRAVCDRFYRSERSYERILGKRRLGGFCRHGSRPGGREKVFPPSKPDATNRALLGASLGGITSFHIALKHPEIFGRIGGQSSSFWVDNERVVKELEKLDASKNKFTFYIDDGTLEGVEDSRKVVKLLKDKGYNVTYIEGEAGHNWTAWRNRLADAFIALWKE